MTERFSNKTIVITGAGGILCSEFARHLAAQGAKIAVVDLRKDAAIAVADGINAAGGTALAVAANCLHAESLKAAREVILERFGVPDILINGAGGNNPRGTTDDEEYERAGTKTFFDLDPEGFRFVMDLNLVGTMLPTQIFAKDMAEAGKSATILNISSMNAFRPLTKIPAYSAAKAAVSNFTQWLAVYFAKSGIRVNAMAPGFFVTDQNRALLFNDDGTPTARTDKILRNTPMGRFGESSELLGTLDYLLDDTVSGFVTGVVIPVDGGFSAYSGV